MNPLGRYPAALYLLVGSSVATPLAGEPEPDAETAAMVKAMTPGSQHAFLAAQAGTWKATLVAGADPSAPTAQGTGTVERTMILGGRVLHEVITAELMGMPFEAVGHVGYDNVTGEYWTTSFDNFSTGLTVLTGTIDESTSTGTLVGETPMPMAGTMVPMRLVIYEEGGKQVMDSYVTMQGKDVLLLRAVYERQ